jgi:hypothetical protein
VIGEYRVFNKGHEHENKVGNRFGCSRCRVAASPFGDESIPPPPEPGSCVILQGKNVCSLLGYNTNGTSGCKKWNSTTQAWEYDPTAVWGITQATVLRPVPAPNGQSGNDNCDLDPLATPIACNYRSANGLDAQGNCVWAGLTQGRSASDMKATGQPCVVDGGWE